MLWLIAKSPRDRDLRETLRSRTAAGAGATPSRAAGIGPPATSERTVRRGGAAHAVSGTARYAGAAQVPGEESDRAVDFERRDPEVAAGVGMQGLLGGAEC